MVLGERVALDRKQAGLSQVELARQIHTLLEQNPGRAPKLAKKLSIPAMRTWLAKLEAGSVRRNVTEGVRTLLAEALGRKEDIELYRTLPLLRPTGPANLDTSSLPFESMFVFSQSPFELRRVGYASLILRRWLDAERTAVYFVPNHSTAAMLCEKFYAAAEEIAELGVTSLPAAEFAIQKNLNIEITRATSLMPHWTLLFFSKSIPAIKRQAYVAVETPHGEAFELLPEEHTICVLSTLETARLITPDARYRKGKPRGVRSVGEIHFATFEVRKGCSP